MSKRNGNTAKENQIQQIFVKNLPGSRYQLKKPIAVSVTKDQNTSIARYDKIDSFGLGQDTDEAVQDLMNELCDIYQDLEANQQTLGTVSAQWWYHLKQIIKRNAND